MNISKLFLLGMAMIGFHAFANAQHNPTLWSDAIPDTAIVKAPWHPTHSQSRTALPKSVDNSTSRYFPPIIDQKGGSCAQASGIGYMFTYEINRMLDRDASQSDNNRFSYLFTWNFLNDGEDVGGFVDQGLNIAVKYGIMTEADFGYASAYQFKWASRYEKYLNAMRYRGKQMYQFPSTSQEGIQRIKEYLYQKEDGKEGGGILTFSTMTNRWSINDKYQGPSETGYHSILTGLASDGAHALTIAGYDDTVEFVDASGTTHYGAFIVVNSWGRYMHDKGRFYFPYYFFEHRGPGVHESILSTSMTGIEASTHQPLLVFKIKMDYTSRNDLSFIYGASDKLTSEYPSRTFKPIIFLNQGGDYGMNGAFQKEGEFEFALDYTEQLPSADYLHPKYFLNIVRSERGRESGKGKVLDLSLIDYRAADGPKEYKCRNIDEKELSLGDNLFSIYTRPSMTISGSSVRWLDKDQHINTKQTYIIRTAKGKYAKLKFVGYDSKTGKVTIQYLHQHDGTRNLTKE